MNKIATTLLFVSASFFAACGGDGDHGHNHPHDGEAGDNHEQGDGDGHAHTAAVTLGEVSAGAIKVTAIRRGELIAGKELELDIQFAGGMPESVRGWIGNEAGTDARKSNFGKSGDNKMHGHPELPNPVAEDAKLWLEVDGTTISFVLK